MEKAKFFRCIAVLASFFVLSFVGCGSSQSPDKDPSPIDPKKTVTLLLFSAPWCGECAPKIHEVDSGLAAYAPQVKGSIFMVEGKRPHSFPTAEVASEYAAKLAVPYPVAIDPWHWTNYGLYYPGHSYAIPGCVLLNSDGKVLRVFERGTFTAEEVRAEVESALR